MNQNEQRITSPVKAPARTYDCSLPGCPDKADRIPVLLVPGHPLSVGKHDGVRSVLWVPLCRKHFTATSVRELLSNEAVRGIQASISADFHASNAVPDFNKAQVNFIHKNEPEFAQWEENYRRAMGI